jgi:hypothetical protein
MAAMSTAKRCVATVVLAAAALLSLPGKASAAQVSELGSVLAIAKSSNRNQVNYSLLVDDACAPAGHAPVRPYWRMLERGPLVTEPLSDSEQRVLGVERQEVAGSRVQIALRGMPDRPIVIETQRTPEGRCSASAEMTIAGVQARVASVFVQQRFLGIGYVLLTGWSQDGKTVSERLSP